MNVFIIAAQTKDGFIAKDENHAASWTSKEDKRRFVELTKKAGVIVMGSKTANTLPFPLKDRLNIVYTRNPDLKREGFEYTQKSPQDLIEELSARGYTDVAICGGTSIYTLFMKSGLVSKLYLTIEPISFGTGLPLFYEDFSSKLKLIKSETVEGTLFNEYEVLN
jgi:dihydrofolate reductase